MIRLYQAVADAVARAARPLLLSGDCTTALGAVAGLQRRHGDAAVVWLDGHGDFNTLATTITGYLGGMPLAMLTGRAPELISDPLGLRPVADSDVVLVDARDLDPAERDTLAASRIRGVPAEPGEIGTVLAGLGESLSTCTSTSTSSTVASYPACGSPPARALASPRSRTAWQPSSPLST
jgi:arginase